MPNKKNQSQNPVSLFNLLYKASKLKPKDADIKRYLEKQTGEDWSYSRIGEYKKAGAGIPQKYFKAFCISLGLGQTTARQILFDWYTWQR